MRGVLFDVEHADFWWNSWGTAPTGMAQRLRVARECLTTVPRLTPLWANWYVADTDNSPVFDIMQTDLYAQALDLAALVTGASQQDVPVDDYTIGDVPFWSELHAYIEFSHHYPASRFAGLGQGRG